MPLDDRPLEIHRDASRQTELLHQLSRTRSLSLELAAPLSDEDQVVQAAEDASPVKWHLAHTTWFFEELILKRFLPGYRAFDDRFAYCFNSYYESLGERHPRPKRGLLTRPSADEVRNYRKHVDSALTALVSKDALGPDALSLIETGVHHEQQHQELLLMDVLTLFASSPLKPEYRPHGASFIDSGSPGHWHEVQGGVSSVGHQGKGFHFDNEGPPHDVLLRDFKIFTAPITNGEWLAFMADGGYDNPRLWRPVK